MTTGTQLRDERKAAGIVASHVAAYLGRHPAYITHLEQRDEVPVKIAARYRRALVVIRSQKRELGRQLIKRVMESVP